MHAHIRENGHYCSTVHKNQHLDDPQVADKAHFHGVNLDMQLFIDGKFVKMLGQNFA